MSTQTLLSRLYHWEKSTPNTVHFVQPAGGGEVDEFTWAGAMDQVRRMAAHLQSLHLPPQSNIALVGKNTAHWMMADWAIWMAGHVTVPIYPTLNADSLRYILEHSEARLIFIGKLDDWEMMRGGVAETLPGISLPLAPATNYGAWNEIVTTTEPLPGEPDAGLDALATIVYTSGSTGQPKGVMHSFRAFEALASRLEPLLQATTADRVISYLPLAHVLERAMIETMSCYCGCTVYFSENLETFADDLRRARPTVFVSVPRLWTKFQAAIAARIPGPITDPDTKRTILTMLGLQDVRFAGTGSAPLPPDTAAWYRNLGLELLEGYGMSEDFAVSHLSRPGEMRVGYVGTPYDGVTSRIADNGEVQLKSPGNMLGYYKAPELTVATYTDDGFFKTGDLGEYDEQGRLRITGRLKELFKTSKGKYVAPAPIENKLMAHPGIEAVCVAGANQPATFALVMLAEDARAALYKGSARDALQQDLLQCMHATNAQLDPHERLRFLAVVDEVWSIENEFLTPTMKIKRNVIEKFYADRVEAWYAQPGEIVWPKDPEDNTFGVRCLRLKGPDSTIQYQGNPDACPLKLKTQLTMG